MKKEEPICVQTGITCGYPCWHKCPRWDIEKLQQADVSSSLPEPEFDDDDEDDFQCCDNCDLPDACADFGCAIKSGVRKYDGIL